VVGGQESFEQLSHCPAGGSAEERGAVDAELGDELAAALPDEVLVAAHGERPLLAHPGRRIVADDHADVSHAWSTLSYRFLTAPSAPRSIPIAICPSLQL